MKIFIIKDPIFQTNIRGFTYQNDDNKVSPLLDLFFFNNNVPKATNVKVRTIVHFHLEILTIHHWFEHTDFSEIVTISSITTLC